MSTLHELSALSNYELFTHPHCNNLHHNMCSLSVKLFNRCLQVRLDFKGHIESSKTGTIYRQCHGSASRQPPTPRAGFNLNPVWAYVGFAVDKVALGHTILTVLHAPCATVVTSMIDTRSFICHQRLYQLPSSLNNALIKNKLYRIMRLINCLYIWMFTGIWKAYNIQ
jgi:hypothetical protein